MGTQSETAAGAKAKPRARYSGPEVRARVWAVLSEGRSVTSAGIAEEADAPLSYVQNQISALYRAGALLRVGREPAQFGLGAPYVRWKVKPAYVGAPVPRIGDRVRRRLVVAPECCCRQGSTCLACRALREGTTVEALAAAEHQESQGTYDLSPEAIDRIFERHLREVRARRRAELARQDQYT